MRVTAERIQNLTSRLNKATGLNFVNDYVKEYGGWQISIQMGQIGATNIIRRAD